MNIFKKLFDLAKSHEEKEGFLKMIQMMLCLRKHERLRRLRRLNGR
jgi:hypothetical protein